MSYKSLMKQIVCLAVGLLSLTSAATPAQPDAREAQWKSDASGGGTYATVKFMSWDLKSTVFTVSCDKESKEIVLQYEVPTELVLKNVPPLAIGPVVFKTKMTGFLLEGRSKLTSRLRLLLLTDSEEITIEAPNEMEEPWYIGQAEPLRRVALACR